VSTNLWHTIKDKNPLTRSAQITRIFNFALRAFGVCTLCVCGLFLREAAMDISLKQALFWAPRVLGIVFTLFMSLFALDVFGEGYSLGETILGLLIHLIPTFILVIALIIGWRWELIGAILFTGVGLFFLVSSRGESWIVSGPLVIVGVLFLLDRTYGAPLKAGR
jgi:hypothetical protein